MYKNLITNNQQKRFISIKFLHTIHNKYLKFLINSFQNVHLMKKKTINLIFLLILYLLILS